MYTCVCLGERDAMRKAKVKASTAFVMVRSLADHRVVCIQRRGQKAGLSPVQWPAHTRPAWSWLGPGTPALAFSQPGLGYMTAEAMGLPAKLAEMRRWQLLEAIGAVTGCGPRFQQSGI